MRFDYTIYENIRGTRSNNAIVDISDNELAQLASECDDREEFEDRLRDWLYNCEWDNINDFEDEIDDSEETEHGNDFYSCISEACDKFFGDDTTDNVDSRRRRI